MRSTVFLVLDSLRRDHVGAYADDVAFTPHLDAIAEDAVVFEDAVAQAPWTLPSHASMFTGTYPWEHEATNRKAHLETDRETLAERFRAAGATTGAVTPNIWLTPHKGTTDGFEHVENFLGIGGAGPLRRLYRAGSRLFERLDERLRRPVAAAAKRAFTSLDVDTACRSAETVDAAVEFLEAHADEEFFLFVNLMEPHEPYDPPPEYLDRHGVADRSGVPDDNEDFFDGARDYAELRKAYRASVDYTDDLVGRLDDALSRLGLDDAVLAVAADHGQALGEDDDFGHQFTVREEVVSVPLLVRHPEEPPRRVDDLVELRELYDLLPRCAGVDGTDGSGTDEFDDAAIGGSDDAATDGSDDDIDESGDGIEDYDDLGTAVAPGGYEFPDVFRRYIDESELDRYYRKYRYYRTPDEAVVKTVRRDGTTTYGRRDRETGAELPVEAEHRRALDRLGEVEGEQPLDAADHSAAVERRLEDLGYL